MSRNYPSMPPGAIIGYQKNGAPIRIVAGGSEAATEPPAADPAAPPAPAADPAPPASDPAAPSGQEPPAPPAEPTSVDQLPSWAQQEIRKTRNEAAANRAKANEHAAALAALQTTSQAQLDAIARTLGLKPEEATPEQIMAQRDAERARADASASQARQAAVELAVFRAANASQANGNALLDSRSFVATLDGLDPSAADFGQQVADKIAAAVEGHPGFRLAAPPPPPVTTAPPPPAVPKSGTGPVTGVPDGPRQWTEEDVKRASPSEVQKAMNDGLLQNLGFGTARKNRR
jgi:hypothetical protein